MVHLDVPVLTDPLIADHRLAAAFEHPAHQRRAGVRIALAAMPFLHELLQHRPGRIRREISAGTAQGRRLQIRSEARHVLPCDHGTHAVAEHQIREIRETGRGQIVKLLLILHHRLIPGAAPVAPRIVHYSRLPVSHMIIRRNDKTGVDKSPNHMEIAAGMLSEAMDQLNDAGRLRRRHIDPVLHIIASVDRSKTLFIQHIAPPENPSYLTANRTLIIHYWCNTFNILCRHFRLCRKSLTFRVITKSTPILPVVSHHFTFSKSSFVLSKSSATLALVRQAVHTQSMRFSVRDESGFTPTQAAELQKRINEIENGNVARHDPLEG